MLTTKEVAERIGVKYTTVMLWLRENKLAGAVKEDSPRGEYWLIPESSIAGIKKRGQGRPRTQFDIYHPVYMEVSEDAEWDSMAKSKQNAKMLAAVEQANKNRVQRYTLMETKEENLRLMRRAIDSFERDEAADQSATDGTEPADDQGDAASAKPKPRASKRATLKKALKKMAGKKRKDDL